jgi:hypothetical protein
MSPATAARTYASASTGLQAPKVMLPRWRKGPPGAAGRLTTAYTWTATLEVESLRNR